MASQLDFIINLTDQLTRPLRQVQESVTGFAERSQAAFARIGVGAAGLWGVIQGVRTAMDPAWEMQAALGELDAKGVGADALEALTTRAMKLGTAFGVSSTEIIRSAWHIRGALDGMTDGDLPRVTAAVSTMAVATRSSTEEASGYLAAMGARFRGEFEQLGAVGFAEELAGKTAWMVQEFGVEMSTMQALIEGTKNAGADFGVSMAEQFAVLGSLSKTLGTEASGMYEQFLKSAPAAAEKLGMSFVDATGRLLPMGDILDRLQRKYGQNIEGNAKAQRALDEAFGGAADVIKKLWGQQDRLNRSIAELGRNDGMKRATEMAETMADPWDRLVAAFYNIRAAIGNALYPILAPLVTRLAEMGATLVRWLNMFPNIARWLGYITLGMLSFGAAGALTNIIMGVFSFIMTGHKGIMKAVTFTWQAGAKALGWLRTSFIAASLAARIAGVSMLSVLGPVALIAAGIAAVVVAVIKFWQPVKAFFAGFMAGFSQAADSLGPVKAAFGGIADALGPVWQGVKTLFGWFSDLLSPVELTTGELNSVTSAGQACGRFVAAAVGLISAPLEMVTMGLETIVQMFSVIISGWGRVIDAFDPSRPVESFKNIAAIIGDVFGNLWSVIKGSFNRTWNWIAEKLNKIPGISLDLKPVEQVEDMTPEAVRRTQEVTPPAAQAAEQTLPPPVPQAVTAPPVQAAEAAMPPAVQTVEAVMPSPVPQAVEVKPVQAAEAAMPPAVQTVEAVMPSPVPQAVEVKPVQAAGAAMPPAVQTVEAVMPSPVPQAVEVKPVQAAETAMPPAVQTVEAVMPPPVPQAVEVKPVQTAERTIPRPVQAVEQAVPPVVQATEKAVPVVAKQAQATAPVMPERWQTTRREQEAISLPPLAGSRIATAIPQGGIRNQIRTDNTTHVNNSRTFGNLTINNQNPMTPGQLEEWTELYAG